MIIKLDITEIEDVELKEKNIKPYLFTRIFCSALYEAESGHILQKALVDTGAIVSLLPKRIWKKLKIDFVGEHTVKGIVKKQECVLPVKIGVLNCKLVDDENETPSINILAYCVDSDDVPVIMGMKDALDKFKIEIDIKTGTGYLVFS